MGDYANDALRWAAHNMYYSTRPVRRRPKTHQCPQCERILRGLDALHEHQKAKHEIITEILERDDLEDQAIADRDETNAENKRLCDAVKWYGERAHALTNYKDQSASYLEAVYVELSLDGGRRAREALKESTEAHTL